MARNTERTQFSFGRDLSEPPSPAELERIIAAGESDFAEFKQEWWDLDQPVGKALLTKTVLALANSVRPDNPSYLLIGVDDEGEVVGVDNKPIPAPETVSNILSNYVNPPAALQCRHVEFRQRIVSVLTIAWSPARPHHALRQHEGLLLINVVYVRRDRTIGTLTLPEIERMIREKDAHLGPLIGGEPIQAGFIEKAEVSGGGALVVRVSNVTTEPVTAVDVMFDVRHARNPELFHRTRKLHSVTLSPGESREVQFRPNEIDFYTAPLDIATGERKWFSVRNLGSHIGDHWLDVILHVDYRDRDGFIRHVEQRIALDA
jgi:hypothetical protein